MTTPSLSLEFFPPRSDAQLRRFWYTLGCLQTLDPAYISVTWGALGSGSAASLEVLEALVGDCPCPIAAHLSCSGQTGEQMEAMIARLEGLGLSRFLALRGDVPETGDAAGSATLKHASELVSLLAQNPERDISVAAYPEAHPESPDTDTDLSWLKYKLDAGASRAITQFFFEPETFLRFRDRAVAKGIHQPLVPGILPVHDIRKVMDFSDRCGATVSAQLISRFESATTPESRETAAVEQCVELCQTLGREGVDEFHLYTLNQAPLSYRVGCELLGRRSGGMVVAA